MRDKDEMIYFSEIEIAYYSRGKAVDLGICRAGFSNDKLSDTGKRCPMYEKSIELLNRAVADELSAVHQYMYFHFHCDDQGMLLQQLHQA